MQENRFLLPFTQGVDSKALHTVLQFSKATNASIVALALLPLSAQQRPEEVRLEHIQQARDFLELLTSQATMHNVSIEHHECFTHDVPVSIRNMVDQLHCRTILLCYEEEKVHFLRTCETEQLRAYKQPSILYVPSQQKATKNIFHQLKTRLMAHLAYA